MATSTQQNETLIHSASQRLGGDGGDQVLARDNGSMADWDQTDDRGAVRAEYSAFGVITSESNASVGGRYKYTAEPWDSNTGLQYIDARYYNPATGQWISQDPAGFAAGSSNLYEYVGNDPTNEIDPSGLYEEDIHYSMTFYLAIATGIPSVDAEEIAWAANAVDCYPKTEPVQLDLGLGINSWKRPEAVTIRRKFHFRTVAGGKTVAGSNEAASIVNDAIRANVADNILLGIGLHAYEDSWSHAGFGPEEDHANQIGKDNPDYPYNGPKAAMEMAEAVYNKLVAYRAKHFPNSKPLKSFADISKTLVRLMALNGNQRERAKNWNQQIQDDFTLDTRYDPNLLKEPRRADALWTMAQTIQEPKK